MEIIEPSGHIEELPENIYQRIDKAASVCYQRPAKPTVEEAMEFCQGMIKRKHWMPLEFATVHLVVNVLVALPLMDSKYLFVKPIGNSQYLATGSIRAFLEYELPPPLEYLLHLKFPVFFKIKLEAGSGEIRFAELDEIPWQHEHVAVRVVCSRAISHQLVRHRPCAILQESQRFCRYDGERFDGEVTFIRPAWTGRNDSMMSMFILDCKDSENKYFDRLKSGLSPQESRGALANDAKTELLIYANLPEWQHILNKETMRCSSHADPEMQRIMKPLREEFKARWPEVF